jgi:hypothetical protein
MVTKLGWAIISGCTQYSTRAAAASALQALPLEAVLEVVGGRALPWYACNEGSLLQSRKT